MDQTEGFKGMCKGGMLASGTNGAGNTMWSPGCLPPLPPTALHWADPAFPPESAQAACCCALMLMLVCARINLPPQSKSGFSFPLCLSVLLLSSSSASFIFPFSAYQGHYADKDLETYLFWCCAISFIDIYLSLTFMIS